MRVPGHDKGARPAVLHGRSHEPDADPPVRLLDQSGAMFWLTWNTLPGS
jgi:hypothetical protein